MAIEELSPEVGVILLEYGNGLSDNVAWELRTLLRHCIPEKLVVPLPSNLALYGLKATTDKLHTILRAIVSSDRTPQFVTCPSQVPLRFFNPKHEAVIRPVQRVIGIAALSK